MAKNIPATLTESENLHREVLDATVGKVPNAPVNQSSTSAQRRDTMGLDDTFSFGKYSGKRTLEYVIDHDIGYIDWLTENDVVYFDEEAYEYIENIKFGDKD